MTQSIEDRAKRLFEARQTTPVAEADGELTLEWQDLSEEYRAAWMTVAEVDQSASATDSVG